MRNSPIMLVNPLVLAVLEGRKGQTRRNVKPKELAYIEAHRGSSEFAITEACPFGQAGDRLWVRESARVLSIKFDHDTRERRAHIRYEADGYESSVLLPDRLKPIAPGKCIPNGCHREAARIHLEIGSVRIERLQDISEADAIAEGARRFDDIPMGTPSAHPNRWSMENPTSTDQCLSSARYAFANVFCKLYGNGRRGVIDFEPWDSNPWVWAIEFKRVEAQKGS